MAENTTYEQKDLTIDLSTAYEQKDLNIVVSEPIRNPWVEMGLNAKAYFEAYRGQCRLRIDYASLQVVRTWGNVDWKPYEWCKTRAEFWERSYKYWTTKLEESFQREKDYMEGK